MSAPSLTRPFDKLEFLKLMLLSREGDRREGILLRQSKGWFQVSGTGHEALGAVAWLLRKDDWIFPYYRDRALMLGRGLTDYELALAYFAKRESGSGGRQMPGHYSSREHNVFSVSTPTGASLLPACGTAWGMKLNGKDSVCIATIGDASARQGEFYEAIAFAAQESLPVVFLVEDNKYGISTPTAKFLPFHLGLFSDERVTKVDARHPERVLATVGEAVNKARSGDGPTIVWCDLDRLSSHTSSDDHRVYRKLEEIEEMSGRDPIRVYAEELIADGLLNEPAWLSLQEEVVRIVDADYLRAETMPDPRAEEVLIENFGGEIPAEAPPLTPEARTTMVHAINETLRKQIEREPTTVMFGEDIEDPKGGVFGVTKGLSESFPENVFNSPLAEATLMGVAVGLAAYGRRPVFELQFIDFMAPGWNQITTNLSTLRWRSFGAWKCPMLVYAPYGAYLPGGSLWHSQANEAYLAHTTGIKVAIPSTPQDAAGLFWTAMASDDPCFILVPKHVFRKPTAVEAYEPVPFGKARTVREGADVTVVAYGNCVEIAEAAADASGVSVEILDLRSIVPLDYDAITASLEKTGRLVVIHEDNHTCGVGQAILAEMTRIPDRWNLFLSPPQLVAREDVPIGYNPIYEYAALPDVEQVVKAIRLVME